MCLNMKSKMSLNKRTTSPSKKMHQLMQRLAYTCAFEGTLLVCDVH